MNPVQRAAFELRLEWLHKLLDEGQDTSGALLSACSAHDADGELQVRVIRLLLERGVPIDETDKNGVTPLHRAVRFRSPAAVEELLRQGADGNAQDRRSRSTPLHRAVVSSGAPATAGKEAQALVIARLLLAGGADPEIRNQRDLRPIDAARGARMRELLSKKKS